MDIGKLIAQNMQKKTEREIKILQKHRHPHLVRIYEAIKHDNLIHVVMEFVPGGELFDQIANHGRMAEEVARCYFQQIVSCMEFCHNHKIAHRDLKPENILLDENKQIKVADFGLSNRMKDGRFLFTSCGSPNYAAPEVVSGKAYCGSEVDIWSMGVILYAMLVGRLPFDDNTLSVLFTKIREAHYITPCFLSPESSDLLHHMIEPDVHKRFTIPEIKHHKWFLTNLPFYLHILDNTKSEFSREIDEEIFNQLREVIKWIIIK